MPEGLSVGFPPVGRVLPEGLSVGFPPVGRGLSVLPEGLPVGLPPVGRGLSVLPEGLSVGLPPVGLVLLPEGLVGRTVGLPVGCGPSVSFLAHLPIVSPFSFLSRHSNLSPHSNSSHVGDGGPGGTSPVKPSYSGIS